MPEPFQPLGGPVGGGAQAGIEGELQTLAAEILGLECGQLSAADNMSEYGFDSITLSQFAAAIRRRWPALRVGASAFLENPTIRSLAGSFAAVLGPPPPAPTAAPAPTPAPTPAWVPTWNADARPMLAFDLLDGLEADIAAARGAATAGSRNEDLAELGDAVAVIGMAGRFPGAASPGALWRLLSDNEAAFGEVPADRWDWRAIHGDPNQAGDFTDCRLGGFLPDADAFDCGLFGIAPAEAAQMDPQQRIVLESVWAAIEDAALDPDALTGRRVAFYAGVQRHEHLPLLLAEATPMGPYLNTGNTHSMLANRVSYAFGWTGPSMAIDTACSSSAVAIHQAVQALRRGEAELAVAGGVTVVLGPFSFVANRKMGLLTGDGPVRPFDAEATGHLIGEGAAMLVLKPLGRARCDGDFIHGVIRGSAVNQSGRTVFLTAPDPAAHAEVMRACLADAGVTPDEVDYVEAQGTANDLSDKAELRALADVFAGRPAGRSKLRVGSVKANIGHLEAAAGAAALIKVMLAMKNRTVPATLNFARLNWDGSTEGLPFEIADCNRPWPAPPDSRARRRAGIHNFGYGGTNVHILVEEWPAPCGAADLPEAVEPAVIVLSARTRAQLRARAGQLHAYLRDGGYRSFGIDRPSLASLAFTLQRGRKAMRHRLAFVAASLDGAAACLGACAGNSPLPHGCHEGEATSDAPPLPSDASLDDVARHWVTGTAVAWEMLHRTGPVGRVPLPTYPFDRERFRLPRLAAGRPAAPDGGVSTAYEALERHSRLLLLAALRRLGVFQDPGERHDAARLAGQLGVAPRHRRLFAALLDMLERAGWASLRDGTVSGTAALADPVLLRSLATLGTARQDILRACPALHAQLTLVHACLDRLGDLLRDVLPGTDVLFPDGAMDRVAGIYQDHPVAAACNRRLAEQLSAAVQAAPAGRPVHILEVGAGTGGTTVAVLDALRPWAERVRYTYTDVSAAFTRHGERRYGRQHAFFEFRTLDIEADPAGQGFAPGGFDLVIAANVLHATRDVRATLRHVHSLLRPGGTALLNEATARQDHITLTFGWLEGWWLFEDAPLRLPHGPLLASATWERLLGEVGFASVACASDGVAGVQDVIAASTARFAARQATPGLGAAIAACVAEVVGRERMGRDDTRPFREMGVDSLAAVEIVQRLNRTLGLQLRKTDLFSHASIGALCAHVAAQASGDAPTAPVAEPPPPPTAEAGCVPTDGIAVVGMAGRFADSPDLGTLWEHLAAGRDCVREVPAERWDTALMFDADPAAPGRSCSKWGGFVPGIDQFDAQFFGISTREAELMDPQQRLFLQACWQALEDAGHAGAELQGTRCGVFAGVQPGDYIRLLDGHEPHPSIGTGNSNAILASRISYVLNLKGPALAIETACSSSLVAVRLACESLQAGTCDMALAGGVSLMSTPAGHLILGKSGMLSPDGRCKAFGAGANGFVPGEGVGVVVLKPLARALADGDHVYGVIRAGGINQDGRTNGITAPSAAAQATLIADIHREAGIDPESIDYVEAHGTGTRLGDPIEIQALTDAFALRTGRRQFCAVGSVKSNIGHTLAAAGIAGLIKVLLCLHHRTLVATLHAEEPSTEIAFAETPFFLCTALRPWPAADGRPRRAGVSAFGFSGTNAHLVVEEAPAAPGPAAPAQPWHIVVLSGRTPQALSRQAAALAGWLERHGATANLRDVAATLAVGRSHLRHRLAVVGADAPEVARVLARLAQGQDASGAGTAFVGAVPPEVARTGPAMTRFAAHLTAEARRSAGDAAALRDALCALADLHAGGVDPDWPALFPAGSFRRQPLPAYPFETERHWAAPGRMRGPAAARPTQEQADPLEQAEPGAAELGELHAFRTAFGELRSVARHLVLRAFRRMGAFRTSGERYETEALKRRLGVVAAFDRLFPALTDLLAEAGWFETGGGWITATPRLDAVPAEAGADRRLAEAHPGLAPFLRLLSTCIDAYPDILSGRTSAVDVMFPGGSFELVEGIYRGNPATDYFNRRVADAVSRFLRGRRAGEAVRIIEIGAGTGSTTAGVLAAIEAAGAAADVTYVYTDLSPAFVRHGRKTFGGRLASAEFRPLDIGADIGAQGFEAGSFDLLIAANVLHATRDIAQTVGHAAELLRPGGQLVLNEATDVQPFANLTFGLLEGWWMFEDADTRLPGSPLLDVPGWRTLLARLGFTGFEAVGPDCQGQQGPGQHVILANRGGVAAVRALAPPAAAPPILPALRHEVEGLLIGWIQDILDARPGEVRPDVSFLDYGLDSLLGIQLLATLNKAWGTDVRTTALFDHPTVRRLADFLVAGHEAVIRGALAPAQPATVPAAETPASPVSPAPSRTAPAADAIAVIGMAGRFPGARNLDEFWANLEAGRESVADIPASRWKPASQVAPALDRRDPPGCRRAGKIDGVDLFDPVFFGMSGREAEMTDPQQRLFLEECWNALEDAGYAHDGLAGSRCGVFAGAGPGDYLLKMLGEGVTPEAQAFWGNSSSVIPARIAYFLDLKGPSLAIDTACSSSLVAVHAARQSILAGECDMALAGGVFVCTTPAFHVLADNAGALSPSGTCRAFADGADGFVFGEGVGAILLKRLEAALADGDHIHAVIRASGVNQDGRTNGISAPSARAQTELLLSVYREGGIDPDSIGLVEAHGTGTPLGDPIEIEALTAAFRRHTDRRGFCAVGSVKANIGHASAAAGIAGLLKAILALRHRRIPPAINFARENPRIRFAETPFHVNTVPLAWDGIAGPRRAAVSGFGISGTNCHMVVEQPPPSAVIPAGAQSGRPDPQLIVLSAMSRPALRQRAIDLRHALEGAGNAPLRDISFTLLAGRRHFPVRRAFVAHDVADLARSLDALAAGEEVGALCDLTNAVPSDDPERRAEGQSLAETLARMPAAEAGAILRILAGLYVDGLDMDWALLFGSPAPRRVPLPTYPFERARYWLPGPTAGPVPTGSRTLFFAPAWEPAPTPKPVGNPRGTVWLFDDGNGIGAAVRQRILDRGGRVVTVEPSGRDGAESCALPGSGSAEDWQCLADRLCAQGGRPGAVLFLWPWRETADLDDAEAGSGTGVTAFFRLCRALLRGSRNGRTELIYGYPDGEPEVPAHAAVGAFARTIGKEDPTLACRCVGMSSTLSAGEIADCLLGELGGRAVAVRHAGRGRRLVRRLHEWSPPEGAAIDWAGGPCLITGGAGGIGRLLADHLADLGATVVLAGRAELTAAQRRWIEELSARGRPVAYRRADVSRAEDVAALVAGIRAELGPLRGVFHAAGITRDGFARNKSPEDFAAVLDAKVRGLVLIDEATASDPLAAFVLFSSLTAVTGNVGQCDYAYANAFMDAFASCRQERVDAGEREGTTLSVAWPQWAEGGMAAPPEAAALAEERLGLTALPAAAALDALHRLLASGRPQAVVGHGRPTPIRAFLTAPDDIPDAPGPAASLQEGGGGENATAGLHGAALDMLRGILADLLKLPRESIHARRPLEEYGIDSILIQRFNLALEGRLGPLPKTLLFEYRTLDALAAFLAERHGDGVLRQAGTARPETAGPPRRAVAAGRGDIAVIGMGGRFSGADDLLEFWDNLAAGRDCVGEVPASRWDAAALYDPDPERSVDGKSYCKWGGFLGDHDKFDPRLFGISPREADGMDPQERLFLEIARTTLEDGGYPADRLAGRDDGADIGVVVGVTSNTYHLWGAEAWAHGQMVSASSLPWSIANRVSFTFNLTGPSLPVDTACSSSLTAIHIAMSMLRAGQCGMALVGGVNLYLHPSKYVAMCGARMLSPTGRCHAFGPGDGFVPGEGVGAVLLKPLDRALSDGNRIHAVIKGGAVNHGGRTNGYMVPSPQAQAALIRAAVADAGVDPGTIGYVEAHGTGTALGDPIEIEGLSRALRGQQGEARPCAIGTVKSNIGHLEAAAGIAGLIKVVLQMQHRRLTPSLHCDPPNPAITRDSPFRVQREAADWPAPVTADGTVMPRRAGVSSFGAGGANAHIVLEEFQAPGPGAPEAAERAGGPAVIVLSARTAPQLAAMAKRLTAFLRRPGIGNAPGLVHDLAYTLQTGHAALAERAAFVVTDAAGLADALRALAAGAQHGGWRGTVRAGTDQDMRRDDTGNPDTGNPDTRNPDPARLAEAWVRGAAVDWQRLHAGRWRRRISLPPYPYARERHWYRLPEAPSDGEPGIRWPALEAGFGVLRGYGRLLVLSALRSMGAFRIAGEPCGQADLGLRLGVAGRQGRLFAAMLGFLSEGGFVRVNGDAVDVGPAAAAPDACRNLAELEAAGRLHAVAHPDLAAYFRLLWACARHYPGVLTGKTAATEVLFPHGSTELVEPVYRGNAIADHFNGLVAQAVRDAVAQRPAGAGPFRILEIGAGTGGTTAAVLPVLPWPQAPVSYDYTDLSDGLVRHGRDRFGGSYPFVRFRVLDIEDAPGADGTTPEEYDLVIATNVLHATRSMRRTLAHVRALLAPGGRLVVNEATALHEFATLTFGLLDGWWLSEDAGLRLPHGPLLDASTWVRLLHEAGFDQVAALPRPDLSRAGLSQDVIVARAALAPPHAGAAVPVEDAVVAAIAAALRMPVEEVELDAAHVDLGIDSILAIDVVRRINAALNVALRSTDLFNFANPRDLIHHVATLAAGPVPPCAEAAEPSVGDDELLRMLQRLGNGEIGIEDAKRALPALCLDGQARPDGRDAALAPSSR